MKGLLMITCLLIPLASAQGATSEVSTLSPALQLIDSTSKTLDIYAPLFRQQPLAEAVRRALVERKVKVNLFTTPEALPDAGSYLTSLALAGANLYQLNIKDWRSTQFFILSDRRYLATGTSLAFPPPPSEKDVRIHVHTDPQLVLPRKTWVENILGVYKPTPPTKILKVLYKLH